MNPLRSDANHCFVCGPSNPIGLKLTFEIRDDVCHSLFTPGKDHCGYDGVTHGGIVFSALDDVMANWLFLKGLKAYTAKCDIRYRDTLQIGTQVRLEGHCLRQKARLTQMKGIMIREDTDQVVAEAEAAFMMATD
ncbi:MAG: PaaI family thioesterase [Pseudomonadales bacterium]|nr:PaaI family thioesterase [Pseudomonadales bacterium]MBO6564098.1 PaaI family thioesterase [Pseudomonadales bacterium]MBO6596441.1 PaaI family thioesterase [Pseudomonadales bacterium]MBO6657313.1 PaaI family thioesterase [Pseudomonadales bacterium]MBO6704331.1 PaaI family thioesterase [Pseudomonadales bacterium]